jgi:hypothetical protein
VSVELDLDIAWSGRISSRFLNGNQRIVISCTGGRGTNGPSRLLRTRSTRKGQ